MSSLSDSSGFLDHFSEVEDPRIDRKKLYSMEEILLLTLLAVVSGCDGWADIEIFGKTKLSLLREYLPYENGTPSDDTLRRFFRVLDPVVFQKSFSTWVKAFTNQTQQVIAIDGKTHRRTHDGASNALHLVSAFAAESRMVLGQTAVNEKSNEITAIPTLIKWLDCEGAIITIDAMGCQTNIAKVIRNKKADYILALKRNHKNMYEQVHDYFTDSSLRATCDSYETVNGGHGRIETRRCYSTSDIDWLYGKGDWKGIQSIIMVESTREVEGKTSHEVRYYISSLESNPERMLLSVRSHWAIENSLHWVLDVGFGEDQSRIRKGNAPVNIGAMRHVALNLMQLYKKPRQSIKQLRKLAGWDDQVLQDILAQAKSF